jgi:hypothetical protein
MSLSGECQSLRFRYLGDGGSGTWLTLVSV